MTAPRKMAALVEAASRHGADGHAFALGYMSAGANGLLDHLAAGGTHTDADGTRWVALLTEAVELLDVLRKRPEAARGFIDSLEAAP